MNEVAEMLEDISDSEKVSEFLINRDKEETQMTLDYAKALLSLDIEIKEIKDDQKEIKADAKANGVSVMKVNKAIANMKKALNESPSDVSEMESIENVLSNDVDIKTMITNLVRKDK